MPSRPANISSQQDILPTVNQLIRELAIRIDGLNKAAPVHRTVGASGTLNIGMVPAGSTVERTLRVTGAQQQGSVSASPQLQIGAHLGWSAYISGTDTVTVRVSNPTNSPITANTVVWNTIVTQ